MQKADFDRHADAWLGRLRRSTLEALRAAGKNSDARVRLAVGLRALGNEAMATVVADVTAVADAEKAAAEKEQKPEDVKARKREERRRRANG